jgi:flagellar hook-associated protein 3 FlgL
MERISSMMTAQSTINDLAAVYEKLADTQQEMSSGLRISQPSDDPYGASQVVSLNGQLSSLTAYSASTDDATTWVSTTTGALTDVENSVQRVRELVVEAGNGTMTASDSASAAAEVNQLIDSIKSSANATYNGSYVFSGTATQTAPYQTGSNDAYQGNSATISRAIGPGVSVAVNTDISQLLGNGTSPGDGKLLDTLRTIASDLQGGSTANGNSLRTTDLQGLDTNLATLNTMQVNAGALTNRLTLASSRIQDSQQSDTAQLSKIQDADLAQTAIEYSTEQAAYTAALKAGATIVQNSLVNFL